MQAVLEDVNEPSDYGTHSRTSSACKGKIFKYS